MASTLQCCVAPRKPRTSLLLLRRGSTSLLYPGCCTGTACTPRAGELRRADPPPQLPAPPQTSSSPAKVASGLHMPWRCSTTKTRLELTPGVRIGQRRRSPAAEAPVPATCAAARTPFLPEPLDPDPRAQNRSYHFSLDFLLKSPRTPLKLTRSPGYFNRNSSLTQFLAIRPLRFSLLEPAVQTCCFCALAPVSNL